MDKIAEYSLKFFRIIPNKWSQVDEPQKTT